MRESALPHNPCVISTSRIFTLPIIPFSSLCRYPSLSFLVFPSTLCLFFATRLLRISSAPSLCFTSKSHFLFVCSACYSHHASIGGSEGCRRDLRAMWKRHRAAEKTLEREKEKTGGFVPRERRTRGREHGDLERHLDHSSVLLIQSAANPCPIVFVCMCVCLCV